MPRVIWKGAISFGLVHIPVALNPASQDVGVDFDWLDQRSMDPVGYQRINKRTGKVITKENVVKGVKVEDGRYVVLTDEEVKAAFPKSTQTIAIEAFVKSSEIDFMLLERPYYLEPVGKAQRVYALLREAMLDAGVLGVSRLIIHSKEHLALLIPTDRVMVLNTIRWSNELRSPEELELPPAGKIANSLKPAELKMAAQLIKEMTTRWRSETYEDAFANAIAKLVQRKSSAGETKAVLALEDQGPNTGPSNVVDLTELLARSLRGNSKKNPAVSAKKAAVAKKLAVKSTSASPTTKRTA